MNDAFSQSSHSFERPAGGNNAPASRKAKRFFKNSLYLPFIGIVIIIGVIGFFAAKNFFGDTAAVSGMATKATATGSTKQLAVEKPKAEQSLNRVFSFPLKDQTGKEVSKFTYELQSAELRNQIIIKGERATAVKGRTFLIVNLKITNNYSKSIQLNVRDYVRLSLNGSAEKLAPDVHNDPVEVQAISTKYTRVGFPINDTDKNLMLYVGEIAGKKESIPLNF